MKPAPGVQSQSEDSCRMTVLDLEWGPDIHPEMWKSSTSSAKTDLKLSSGAGDSSWLSFRAGARRLMSNI